MANDRLDWRAARELTLAGRQLRGNVDDAGTLLFELELARAELARGDVAALQRQLSRLMEGVKRFPNTPFSARRWPACTRTWRWRSVTCLGRLRRCRGREREAD